MKDIKLTFAKKEYVTSLLEDGQFLKDAAGFNPAKINDYNMLFSTAAEENEEADSEFFIINLCSDAISRIHFNHLCYFEVVSCDPDNVKRGTNFTIPVILECSIMPD